ncbi:DNA phosphorothioation-dependent restriction protein DptF [Clostridium chromiireducens]|uniref:DNA phosphorothioation-dependent restriction protein DptF n=1 Tax=Clostridium chromiireducens TaxID=225345 RepID=A0A964RNC9_9CLOT|nr:DNA phosphorothioation-dependent restriction protein DptF [Clostridium chromiireducens]MVX64832.1 DNA phosphorothioation-dependent restriction protein DptF [Clostridium chromiireducens]
MEKDVFSYLEKNYRYLNNYIRDMNEALFISPNTSIIKGCSFLENLTQEIAKLKGYGLLTDMTQPERLRKLEVEGIFRDNINKLFHLAMMQVNKAVHLDFEGQLEAAINVNISINKIAGWFVKDYIDSDFEALPYKSPIPSSEKTYSIDIEVIDEIIKRTIEDFEQNNTGIASTSLENEAARDDALTGLMAESIVNLTEADKKCLVQELSKLKESSKEAVESIGDFTPFKKYMHIERDAQKGLDELIHKAIESDKAQLILVCGSVGDGKSHIISYFNDKYPEIKNNFILHNDATESLEPNKTSMDTLNDVLDEFSDEKIENSNKKIILAINLGTLNNFIDSNKYGERFTKLKQFVVDKKILESVIEDSSFDEKSSFQFINFSDYHLFTLNNGEVYSEYIKSIIQRITAPTEKNYFYLSYKQYCINCENKNCCPIKANYDLLSKDNVQNSIIDLLVQCVVKNKIIISTRALLNFIYELIVPRSYIDVNSATFKNAIVKLDSIEYINSLMPNIIFNHKELSFIFEALSSIDPLNVRNEKVDDFIIDFNNDSDIMEYFNKHIDFPKDFLWKITNTNINNPDKKKNIHYELLKLFIRSYYICGIGELFSLRDDIYDEYMNALFYYNRGDKLKLKNVYENVKNGIMKWNGEAEKEYLNIFIGKNQTKYKVSEKVELKADTRNLPKSDETDIKKFIGTLKLQYKNEKTEESHDIDIDYSLYKLLVQINNGYRPNKKDRNHFIKFIEFIGKLEDTGSQNKELVFIEKNREHNKKYKLEFDEEFGTYRFMEI